VLEVTVTSLHTKQSRCQQPKKQKTKLHKRFYLQKGNQNRT